MTMPALTAAEAFEARRDLYIRAGFAPGEYFCRCAHCTEKFQGDKRASACFGCATSLIDKWLTGPRKPNPAAEAAARLRSIGGPTREEAADLLERQQAEIERLSRERDTGVPEGFWLAPNEPTREMEHAYIKAYDAICAVSDQYDDPFKWFEAGYNAVRAAAPQPPTVSEVASSDLPDEIYVERDAETNEKRWFSCKGMGEKYVHARLLDNWKFVAKHGLAKVTPEHTWAQWLAEMKADLSTLTRERDQAREALKPFADFYSPAADAFPDDQAITPGSPMARRQLTVGDLRRARSVLDPEKEGSK